jgi:chloramphenicol-sensitive protein RarD
VTEQHIRTRAGLLLGLGAYLWWGVMPLYFKVLSHVDSTEIVAHRAVWSLIFLALLLTLWRRWGKLISAMRRPRLMLTLFAAASLIAGNWLVFIWAVNNGHVLETSLGYYLNPLVNVLLGVVLLKERLSRAQVLAVILAAAGVAILAAGAGEWLWISLTLAFSFALYGFVRKVAPVEPVEGLTVETLLMSGPALAWLAWKEMQGAGAFGGGLLTDGLLILSGVITAVPLLLFTAATKRLRYSTLGFLQYIAPSLQFVTAVLLGEQLTLAHLLCFAAIWTALLLFAADGFRSSRAAARERAAAGL